MTGCKTPIKEDLDDPWFQRKSHRNPSSAPPSMPHFYAAFHGWLTLGRLEAVATILFFYSLSPDDPCREPASPMKLVQRVPRLCTLLQSPPPAENHPPPQWGSPSPPLRLQLFPSIFMHRSTALARATKITRHGNGGRSVRCPSTTAVLFISTYWFVGL
jgi:hypothetical protein